MQFRTSKVSFINPGLFGKLDSGLLVKVDTKLHVPKEQVLGNKPELEFHYVTWYH